MTMSCKSYQPLIPAFLDAELDEKQEQELRRHLAECAECRALAEDLKKSLLMFAAVEKAETNLELSPWLAGRIAARAVEGRLARRPWRARLAVAFATMALIVGIFAGYVIRPRFATLDTVSLKSGLNLSAIRFQGDGIGYEIAGDRFVLHTQDKQGKKGIDLKF